MFFASFLKRFLKSPFITFLFILYGIAHRWRSGNRHLGSWDETQVNSIGSRLLYPLSCLAGLFSTSLLICQWSSNFGVTFSCVYTCPLPISLPSHFLVPPSTFRSLCLGLVVGDPVTFIRVTYVQEQSTGLLTGTWTTYQGLHH